MNIMCIMKEKTGEWMNGCLEADCSRYLKLLTRKTTELVDD